jgi:hypothetical protein
MAEAARYIDSLDIKSNARCFILIEPGRGYLVPVLKKKFKDSKIIVLHVDGSFSGGCLHSDPQVPALYGTDPSGVQNFLEKEVPQTDSSLIRIIEWRPSLNFYREEYVKLLSHVVEFIKRLDAGQRTVSVFGRRWVRNFFKNLETTRQTLLYRTTDIPVIVTGSGPSLEEAIPVIRNMRDKCLILAASSSAMALFHNGIQADMVIATDGGIWALQHLYPYFRAGGNIPIAANLCAALPSQCAGILRLIINDGSFWQSVILHGLSLPSVVIPQKGTVTASAVELAMLLSGANIYLAGMDLCVKDIRTHVRPYGFDRLLSDNSCRFSPVYSRAFLRSRQIQEGESYKIYSGWFKNQLVSWPKRIFSLCGNHEVFESALPPQDTAKKTGGFFKTFSVNDDPASLREKGKASLIAALRDSRFSSDIKAELAPLLFPDKKEVSETELEAAINEVSHG